MSAFVNSHSSNHQGQDASLQSAEHALDLLTMFGRVVDDLKHDHPGLNVEPVPCFESRLEGLLRISRQSNNPSPLLLADSRNSANATVGE